MDQTMLISSAEEQLKEFGSLLETYNRKLDRLLQQQKCSGGKKAVISKPMVQINYTSDNTEQLSVMRLLESDRLVNKTLLTFAYLCHEVISIVKAAESLQLQFLYMDENIMILANTNVDNNAAVDKNIQNQQQQPMSSNEKVLLKMSESMQFLCKMQFLIQRCIILGNNILHQCGVYLQCVTSKHGFELRLFTVFDSLSELLLQLLIFDEILYTSCYARFWSTYLKTFESFHQHRSTMHGEVEGTQCSAAEFIGVQNCMRELEFLFSRTIFRNFLDSTFGLKSKIDSQGMGALTQQLNEYMKQQLAAMSSLTATESTDRCELQRLVRLNAICMVFHEFCGQIEGKHVRTLLELNVRHAGAIILIGNLSWRPVPFLRQHAQALIKPYEKLLQEEQRQRQQYLHIKLQTFHRDCRLHVSKAATWTLEIQRALNNSKSCQLRVEQFKELANLLLQGMRQAGQLNGQLMALLSGYVNEQMTMTRPALLGVCRLIETLRMMGMTFQQHSQQVAKVMHCVLQYLQYKVLQLLAHCRKKLTAGRLQQDSSVDALAAIKIAEKCMHGPVTRNRLLVTYLAISATHNNNRSLLSADQYDPLTRLLDRITLLCDFQKNVNTVCCTNFLHWHQSLFGAYLRQIVERRLDCAGFIHMITAFDECGKTLQALGLGDLRLTDGLKHANYDCVRSEVVSVLCARIETFLRLEVHSSNLQLDQASPFEKGVPDYRLLMASPPIELNGRYMLLKDHVENYLSAMFYNLTTISLHDWRTYAEMRHLAERRLSLYAVDDHLPNQQIEQGIDILEIMRKIHIFVSRYVYNMNSQLFVEQQSDNKHLDVIGIRHMANSLSTHGVGVINTSVNFTYQFLRQKFYTFSQFLYDEQIKSRLMKELRSFADRKQSGKEPLYPYERADAFNKDIRRLGLSQEGHTYMDLFRRVITQVGNAMGYIRLVRSGSIHANYSASLFLPRFDEKLQLSTHCKDIQLHTETIKAAENVELNAAQLTRNFSDSTDYFKLLVEAFEPFFCHSHNLHLKNFFLIIPPLIINYVEHMLATRDRINRKDHRQNHHPHQRQEAVLFDDGFAVGLAYILRLLDQRADFNSLQWFGTVRERFQAERRKIKQMNAEITTGGSEGKNARSKAETEKLQQTFALTERRINAHQSEYNFLYYNLSSAKIFFQ